MCSEHGDRCAGDDGGYKCANIREWLSAVTCNTA